MRYPDEAQVEIAADVVRPRTLAAIRDALLPELLSGELRIGEMGAIEKGLMP